MEVPSTGLFKNERHAFIIKEINLHNKVFSSELSNKLKVSEDTIRRDLAELADAGEIIKVHGGALSKSYHYPIQQNLAYAQDAKKAIGKKATRLIRPGMTVLTEAGTTMLEMIRQIPDDLEATFFTVSPLMALELAAHPLLTVILIGGQIDMSSQINIGEKPISELSEINVDLCFLGAHGMDAIGGLTEKEWRVAQVKKAMIRASGQLAIITITEKLNSLLPMKLCKPGQIDYLITELDPEDPALIDYKKNMTLL
ncbi:MAG TPA: DeoR/GlpR family DNA-binding transcription regulator [Arachidicoccus sp.]|nr:DeoR/GlpR family DNA-binding transcription regulator [Arachidicoccus sp.]